MSFFYEVVFFHTPLEGFSYHSEEKIEIGSVVVAPLRKKNYKGVVVKQLQSVSFETALISEVTEFFFFSYQQQLATFLASYYLASLGEAYGVCTPQKRFIQEICSNENFQIPTLSPKQQEALKFLLQHRVSLLFGDTGSGKTEIYIAFFQKILAQQKRVLLLLPEISLTPQMEKRLKGYFGESVVMWHSKLTKKQKEKVLEKIYTKEAKVIAGARSALFLPLEDLGAIVVDEEHDDSYKAQTQPRYNARDIAIYLGKLLHIPVVLGSATPSVTSYKKFPHFRLKEQFFQTNKTIIYDHSSTELISSLILSYIEKNLAKKEQTIIFVPTRANFKYLQCIECGEDFSCAFCHVGMSLHLKSNALKCHYCGFTQPIPKICPQCHKEDTLKTNRIGTAEVLKELEEHFSDATIAQFDRDTITTQKKLIKTLEAFNENKIDILVGTQMLTKGHDYHDVTLAVVLGVDNMLGLSDYRAREKALSTLIQIAGRSGRKKDATVIVQTFHQEFLKSYIDNYEEFLEEELFYREGLYPPFKKLARILFSHKNSFKAQKEMEIMVERLRKYHDIEIVGYGECSIAKIAGKYRFEILLRSSKSSSLHNAIYHTLTPLAVVDIDPLDFS